MHDETVDRMVFPRASGDDPTKLGAQQAAQPAERTYTVKSGDTLSGIAAANGWGNNWAGLAAKNGIANPNRIYPGQVIRL